MRDAWSDIENGIYYPIVDHNIHMAYYRGKIIGWALSFYEKGNKTPRAMFYVARKHRRKGVGTLLLDSVKKYYGKTPFVFWSENDAFFRANGITSKRIL